MTPPQEPGHQPYPSYPQSPPVPLSPQAPKKNTGVIIAVVAALAAGIGIGVGVALTGGDSSSSGEAPTAGPLPVTTTTTTTESEPPPPDGAYSMESVTNACDLVDPTLVHRWSSTPKGEPQHFETPPYSLTCAVPHSTLSTIEPTEYNEAGVELEAAFADPGARPEYDRWKKRDTGTTGTGIEFGDVPGLGEQAYWHEAKSNTLKYGVSYTLAVLDGNLSVKTRISVYLAETEPRPTRADLEAVARAEIQRAMEGLRQ